MSDKGVAGSIKKNKRPFLCSPQPLNPQSTEDVQYLKPDNLL